MSSLYIVGCGKENFQSFISFLQIELRAFMVKHNATFYNLKTLWKAEAIPHMLKKTPVSYYLQTRMQHVIIWDFLM